MQMALMKILNQFQLDGLPVSCEPYGCGHVNTTYLLETERMTHYILQKINHHVFRDVAGLMENIRRVTQFLQEKISEPRGVLRIVPAQDGKDFYDAGDSYWRMFHYVEGSLCLQQPETDEDFYECAVSFGKFQQMLQDFPADRLHETIPDFHNTPDRYKKFLKVLKKDPMNRASSIKKEIEFALTRQQEMETLYQELRSGRIPLCVTHNDTKINNILFDEKTRKGLCIIDLDTIMPGTRLYDYGDSIRFGAATAAEDERDLDKVQLSMERFRIFTRGYICACPGLTSRELMLMPMGAKTMTMECGLRFLTDYLDGDHYFTIHRSGQNLDRCRTQFKLVEEMEQHWDAMHAIVQDEAAYANAAV